MTTDRRPARGAPLTEEAYPTTSFRDSREHLPTNARPGLRVHPAFSTTASQRSAPTSSRDTTRPASRKQRAIRPQASGVRSRVPTPAHARADAIALGVRTRADRGRLRRPSRPACPAAHSADDRARTSVTVHQRETGTASPVARLSSALDSGVAARIAGSRLALRRLLEHHGSDLPGDVTANGQLSDSHHRPLACQSVSPSTRPRRPGRVSHRSRPGDSHPRASCARTQE